MIDITAIENDETTLPFPPAETNKSIAQRDDTDSDDGENDNDYDAASLKGNVAHQATAAASLAMRNAEDDGDSAVAHALASRAHASAAVAMKECGRDDEAAMHTAFSTEHDHQKCRALLKAKGD